MYYKYITLLKLNNEWNIQNRYTILGLLKNMVK